MPPHSKTVRGTFDNPNTKPKSNPTQLGDPVSLQREKNDSVPSPDTTSADSRSQDKSQLPHSKAVRGTLANASGPSVNKSMLGDPVSLKAETSGNELDRGAGPDRDEKEMKKAAEERARRSKL